MCQRTEGAEYVWIWLNAHKPGWGGFAYYYEQVWCHGTFEELIAELKKDAEAKYRGDKKLDDTAEVVVDIRSVNSQQNSLPLKTSTWEQPPTPPQSDPSPNSYTSRLNELLHALALVKDESSCADDNLLAALQGQERALIEKIASLQP